MNKILFSLAIFGLGTAAFAQGPGHGGFGGPGHNDGPGHNNGPGQYNGPGQNGGGYQNPPPPPPPAFNQLSEGTWVSKQGTGRYFYITRQGSALMGQYMGYNTNYMAVGPYSASLNSYNTNFTFGAVTTTPSGDRCVTASWPTGSDLVCASVLTQSSQRLLGTWVSTSGTGRRFIIGMDQNYNRITGTYAAGASVYNTAPLGFDGQSGGFQSYNTNFQFSLDPSGTCMNMSWPTGSDRLCNASNAQVTGELLGRWASIQGTDREVDIERGQDGLVRATYVTGMNRYNSDVLAYDGRSHGGFQSANNNFQIEKNGNAPGCMTLSWATGSDTLCSQTAHAADIQAISSFWTSTQGTDRSIRIAAGNDGSVTASYWVGSQANMGGMLGFDGTTGGFKSANNAFQIRMNPNQQCLTLSWPTGQDNLCRNPSQFPNAQRLLGNWNSMQGTGRSMTFSMDPSGVMLGQYRTVNNGAFAPSYVGFDGVQAGVKTGNTSFTMVLDNMGCATLNWPTGSDRLCSMNQPAPPPYQGPGAPVQGPPPGPVYGSPVGHGTPGPVYGSPVGHGGPGNH